MLAPDAIEKGPLDCVGQGAAAATTTAPKQKVRESVSYRATTDVALRRFYQASKRHEEVSVPFDDRLLPLLSFDARFDRTAASIPSIPQIVPRPPIQPVSPALWCVGDHVEAANDPTRTFVSVCFRACGARGLAFGRPNRAARSFNFPFGWILRPASARVRARKFGPRGTCLLRVASRRPWAAR